MVTMPFISTGLSLCAGCGFGSFQAETDKLRGSVTRSSSTIPVTAIP